VLRDNDVLHDLEYFSPWSYGQCRSCGTVFGTNLSVLGEMLIRHFSAQVQQMVVDYLVQDSERSLLETTTDRIMNLISARLQEEP
jgi:hypothetical protein